jgi:hypothetical protein
MLLNNNLEHSWNDHLLLFTLLLSWSVECVDVLLKRAFVFVRACECVLFVVVAAAAVLNCVRDDVDDDARMLLANDVRSGGGGGACTKRVVFDCVRWFVGVLVRALFLACSYFARNGQLISLALWLCGCLALLQLKHE